MVCMCITEHVACALAYLYTYKDHLNTYNMLMHIHMCTCGIAVHWLVRLGFDACTMTCAHL